MLRIDLVQELNEQNSVLANTIRTRNNIRGSSSEAYQFLITLLRLLYPRITDRQIEQSITDDYRDADFDAVYISNRDKTITLINASDAQGLDYSKVKSFRDNISGLLFNPHQALDGLNPRVQERLRSARRMLNSRDWRVVVIVARKVIANVPQNVRNLIKTLQVSFPVVCDYKFVDINSLIDLALSLNKEQNNFIWNVNFQSISNEGNSNNEKIIFRTGRTGRIKSLFAIINLAKVVGLQKNFVDKGLQLFDLNVRTFQKNKELARKIIESLTDNPKLFYMYHNGITFSCSSIEPINSYSFRIHDPQIINGCQTIMSLYEKFKNNLFDANLRKACILCKFHALDTAMIEKVCEATNTQVKINLWDLRANDDVQRVFETALKAKNIDYRRKMGDRKSGRILITDLAQWVYSCVCGKPAAAKNKKLSLFDLLINDPPYKKIFNEHFELAKIVSICEIADFVKKEIRRRRSSLSFGKDADLHFIAAIFRLSNKNWTMSTKFNRAKTIIKSAIKEMRSQHGKELTYNKIFTKKEQTWQIIEHKIRRL